MHEFGADVMEASLDVTTKDLHVVSVKRAEPNANILVLSSRRELLVQIREIKLAWPLES